MNEIGESTHRMSDQANYRLLQFMGSGDWKPLMWYRAGDEPLILDHAELLARHTTPAPVMRVLGTNLEKLNFWHEGSGWEQPTGGAK